MCRCGRRCRGLWVHTGLVSHLRLLLSTLLLVCFRHAIIASQFAPLVHTVPANVRLITVNGNAVSRTAACLPTCMLVLLLDSVPANSVRIPLSPLLRVTLLLLLVLLLPLSLNLLALRHHRLC